jgi:hypothetical protein
MDTLTLLELLAENRSFSLRVDEDAEHTATADGHILGFDDRCVWFQSSTGGSITCYRWTQVRELRSTM